MHAAVPVWARLGVAGHAVRVAWAGLDFEAAESDAVLEPAAVLRFGILGTLSFLVDAGVLMVSLDLGAVAARGIALPAATMTTWLVNRGLSLPPHPPAAPNLLRYVGASGPGAALNFIVYAALVALPFNGMDVHPLAALAVSSLAALKLSYLGSRRFR
ncbi:hypothetical protein GCM10027034_24770 [Ramlibacter solisilvae]